MKSRSRTFFTGFLSLCLALPGPAWGLRQTIENPDVERQLTAGLEESWQEQLQEAAQQWEKRGWIRSAKAFARPFLEAGEKVKRQLEKPYLPPEELQIWQRRWETLAAFSRFMEALNPSDLHSSARRHPEPEGAQPYEHGYKVDLEIPSTNEPGVFILVGLRINTKTPTPKVRITLMKIEPTGRLHLLGVLRLEMDLRNPGDHSSPIHLDMADSEKRPSWWKHRDLLYAFTITTSRVKMWEAFSRFQEELIRYLIQLPAKQPTAAGLEETRQAAQTLKELLSRQGNPNPIIADLLPSSPSDEDWVNAFLALVRNRPSETVAVDSLPSRFFSVRPYRSGPFARQDLTGSAEADYLNEQWLPAIRKVLEAVALQLKDADQTVTPEQLGLPVLEKFLSHLFYARSAATGKLFLGPNQETDFYRWAYREIPQILVPRLAPASVTRDRLQEALANPFLLSNNAGNDALQQAIFTLLKQPQSRFTDNPALLQENPQRLIPWIQLTLASNLVDYSRDSILQEIQREGDLARYVLARMETPWVEALGAERDLQEFIERFFRQDSQGHWPKRLWAHLPDNNAELAASLKLAEVMLSANPSLSIAMILKADNGAMNDGSVEDAERLLSVRPGVPDIHPLLREYRAQGRFKMIHGPASHGMPLDLLPPLAVSALLDADAVLSEGEANAFSLNGLSKEIYLALRLKWTEGVTRIFGVDRTPEIAAQRPPIFLRIDGTKGPYYQNPLATPGLGEPLTVVQTLAAQSVPLPEEDTDDGQAGLEEGAGLITVPSFWRANGINRKVERILSDPRLGEIPSQVAFRIRYILHEFLQDINDYGYRRGREYRTTLTYWRATTPNQVAITIQDQVARYQRAQGQEPRAFFFSQLPRPPEDAKEWEAIVEEHLRINQREGGVGSRSIRNAIDEGWFRLEESFNPEAGNRYTLTFPISAAPAAQRPHPTAGLEEVRRLEMETFITRHPDQEDFIRGATEIWAAPEGTSIEIYSPETLASSLEELIAAQRKILPGLEFVRKPLPATADRVRRPAVFVLDDLLVITLPYNPSPAVKTRLGNPFPFSLQQLAAIAFLARIDTAGVRVTGVGIFEENGHRFLTIALRSSA